MTPASNGAMRYQAPPNWPTPPPGWTPPSGWRPDPAWGPAPAGWSFWVPDAYATGRYEGFTKTYRTEHERAAGNALTLSVVSILLVLVPLVGWFLIIPVGIVGMSMGVRALAMAQKVGASTVKPWAAILTPPAALVVAILFAISLYQNFAD